MDDETNIGIPNIGILTELRAWLETIGATIEIALDQQRARQDAQIRRTLASKCSQRHGELQWDARLRSADATLQATLELLRNWTGRYSMPEIMDLLVDVQVRVERADEYFRQWRIAEADAELVQLSPDVDEEQLRAAVIRAEQCQRVYALQLQTALALIPQVTQGVPPA